MAMWLNTAGDCNFDVAGIVPAQTTIHLYEGWNSIPFPSFDSSCTAYGLTTDAGALRVDGYDPALPYRLRVFGGAEGFRAGHGYRVRARADTDRIVEAS